MKKLLVALAILLVPALTAAQLLTGSLAQSGVPSGGAVGGTCATLNALARFTAAQTLACSAVVDTSGALTGITTVSMSGQLTSTLATGTAPFVVASTTVVANLNASALGGATFAAPGAIGGGTPSTGAFTTMTATSLQAIIGNVTPAAGLFTTAGIGTGTTAPVTTLQVVDTSTSSPRGIMTSQYNTGTDGARLHMRKGRGTLGTPLTVVTGDNLGRLVASGYDGTSYLEMGSIIFGTEGTIGTNRVPTTLVFQTATNAAPSVLTTRLTISSAGLSTFTGNVIAPTFSTSTSTGLAFQMVDNEAIGIGSGGTSRPSLMFNTEGGANQMSLFGESVDRSYTTGGKAFVRVTDVYAPASGSGSSVALSVNSTCNGTSSGTCYGFGVAMIPTSMTGGTMTVVDFGTTSNSLFTGYTSLFRVNSGGAIFMTALTAASGTPNSICQNSATKEITVNAALTCTVSSARFKDDIRDQDSAWKLVAGLTPRTFRMKGSPDWRVGFIAEEVEKIDRRLVSYDGQGRPHAVRYEDTVSILTKAIQELGARVDALEAR